jgi:hypothetical protein
VYALLVIMSREISPYFTSQAKLPEIFAVAFPDNPDARTTVVKLWGININPTAPVDPRVSVALIKFLRARSVISHRYFINKIDPLLSVN